ncbi:MAG: hypothetical protein NZZ41_02600 [Candidatus Dojkabacteria bacterium]|nr:hypothetical protein [Candidatus Dojkabacteria bacterium]
MIDFLNSLNTQTTSSIRYIGVTRAIPSISLASDLDAKGQRRMDIYFSNKYEGFKAKYSIWFKDELAQSKTGKFRFIDNRANTSIWVDDVTGIQDINFNINQSRKAKIGEVEFVEFMKAWTSYNKNFKVDFPQFDIGKIVSGDLSELQPIFDKLKDTEVVICVGVKEDRYQEVLPFFQPSWTLPSGNDEKSINQITKTLDRFGKAIAKSLSTAIFANILLTKYEEYNKDSAATTVVADTADEIPF